MRYLIVNLDGLVVNAAEWDGVSEWSPGEGLQPIRNDPDQGDEDSFDIGDSWDGEKFVKAGG